MPRKKGNDRPIRPRDSSGHFISNDNTDPEDDWASEIDSTESAKGEDIQDSDFAAYSEHNSSMEESSSDEEAYIERAKAMFGTPETRGERQVRQKSEKWVQELRKRAVRAAEATLDGQMDKAGIKRGPYRQGGSLAPRSIRRKAKELRDEAGLTGLPTTAMQKGLERLKSQERQKTTGKKRQLTIESFFKRIPQPTTSQEPTEVSSASDSDSGAHSRQKRQRSIVALSDTEMVDAEAGAMNTNPPEPSKPSEEGGNGTDMDKSTPTPEGPQHELEDSSSASESIGLDETSSEYKQLESQELEDNEVAEWVDVVTHCEPTDRQTFRDGPH
ncbi:hypothetical protein FRC00_004009 [Tulasnella sp. 408]|nr:hypothetical protein FRC00_004009 [Tulasnella sp. 408]